MKGIVLVATVMWVSVSSAVCLAICVTGVGEPLWAFLIPALLSIKVGNQDEVIYDSGNDSQGTIYSDSGSHCSKAEPSVVEYSATDKR